MPEAPEKLNTFEALLQIIKDLLGPEGCPWDKKQTHTSLVPYAIEEVYEMIEAIENNNDPHFQEELGDVLLQVVLHSGLAENRNAFTIYDVLQSLNEKMIRRHPHVFANTANTNLNSEQIQTNWDQIKKSEKEIKKSNPIDIPIHLPALQRAFKIGEKTKKLNFDWSESKQVLKQLKDEIIELEEVMELLDAQSEIQSQLKSKPQIENNSELQKKLIHEMGDVLFSAAQLSRHLQIEPESALQKMNSRFISRFESMLDLGNLNTEAFSKLSDEAKNDLWQKAKSKEKH